MNELLWSASAVERIHAAKLVTADHEQALQKAICQNCPEEPWPYGITTSLNPIMQPLELLQETPQHPAMEIF